MTSDKREVIGPYRIVRKLAAGGMAEIFLAKQRGLEGVERSVVLKRILPEHHNDEEFVTMFLDEARLLAALAHPNIAQTFDLGRQGLSYYLVMEYVRGPTLWKVLRRAAKTGGRGLPEREALSIVLGVAEALAYVHERHDEFGRPLNIVHRDLNPANVILSYDGAVKLIDFGIAKAASKVHQTRTEVVKGTYGYIAPEQLNQASQVDHRTDVYALGVLMYEVCVGRHPFEAEGLVNVVQRMAKGEFERPRTLRPDFPVELDTLITACLSFRPQDRPQGVRELIDAVVRYMASRRLVPTMGHLAALAKHLVPDLEGPAPLKAPQSQAMPHPLSSMARPTQAASRGAPPAALATDGAALADSAAETAMAPTALAPAATEAPPARQRPHFPRTDSDDKLYPSFWAAFDDGTQPRERKAWEAVEAGATAAPSSDHKVQPAPKSASHPWRLWSTRRWPAPRALAQVALGLTAVALLVWWLWPPTATPHEPAARGLGPSAPAGPRLAAGRTPAVPGAVPFSRFPVRIESDPPTAVIKRGKDILGHTPDDPVLVPIDGGPVQVRLELHGYLDKTLSLTANKRVVHVKLEPDPALAEAEKSRTPKRRRRHKRHRKRRH